MTPAKMAAKAQDRKPSSICKTNPEYITPFELVFSLNIEQTEIIPTRFQIYTANNFVLNLSSLILNIKI